MFFDGGGGTSCGDELGLLRLIEGCGGGCLLNVGRDGGRGGFLR